VNHVKSLASAVTVLLLCSVAYAQSKQWKQFTYPSHFSVAYPANWFRFEESQDHLAIRSSAVGQEAVIIKRGQAFIWVAEAKPEDGKTLSQVIQHYSGEQKLISRKIFPNPEGDSGCKQFDEVISQEPIIPPESAAKPNSVPLVVTTQYFCEIRGNTIITTLRNYAGDTRQNEYQEIALTMAKSIRMQ
jgi:hypothetical protein